MEAIGQLEQVIRQNVWAKIVQDLRDGFSKLAQAFREIDLGCFGKNELIDLGQSLARFAKDRANPDTGILQIRRSISLQRQHSVPRKNVISHPVLREIAVLDGPDSNFARDVDLLRVTQGRVFLIDNRASALARLIEKLAQWYILARTRFHQLAVFAQDAAVRDMAKSGFMTFAARDFKNLPEMQNLRRTRHNPDRVRFQIVDAIVNRRDVGSGVIETAVTLANDAGLVRQLGNITEENADCAFADFRETRLEQSIGHLSQPIVIKTFPVLDVVMNVEQCISTLEVMHRQVDALFPNRQILRIARLQLDQFLPAGFANGRIDCRFFVGLFVNADQLGNRIALER